MRKRVSAVLLSVVMVAAVFAQPPVKARLEGLESNDRYMEMLRQEALLQGKEDSLNTAISHIREQFLERRENREDSREEMMKLENEVFDIRSRLGMVSMEIASIEQEFILSNLDKIPHVGNGLPVGDEESSDLVANPPFRDIMSGEELEELLRTHAMEREAAGHVARYAEQYVLTAGYAKRYAESHSSPAGDSVLSLYAAGQKRLSEIEAGVAERWHGVFDNKLYAYNLLLDKMREDGHIEEFGRKLQRMRERRAGMKGEVMSDEVNSYLLQKELLLDYEVSIARLLGYGRSLDSLEKAQSAFAGHGYSFPVIPFDRSLLMPVYEGMESSGAAKYSAQNPIPKLKIYEYGKIYRIMLGSYPRRQAVSVFKGLYPIGFLNEGETHTYYAGGFATWDEAQEALARVKRLGFRGARTALWIAGECFAVDGDPKATYMVEIAALKAGLPENVRLAISQAAGGADIMRSPEGGFSVGPFSDGGDACRIADAALAADGGLPLRIIRTDL